MHHDGTSKPGNPRVFPIFSGFPISKTRSWTHPVTGSLYLQRILCAKNAPEGTPLKRKSLVLYSGCFFRFLVQIKGFFPAVDIRRVLPCSPAFLLIERSLIRGYLTVWEMKSPHSPHQVFLLNSRIYKIINTIMHECIEQ